MGASSTHWARRSAVGKEVAIKCVRYSTVVNDLRDLNTNIDDQTRNRPVWLNFQQKLC